MRFPVLVNWHCALSQANQPKIQKLEITWCVKITWNRTFLGIAGLSFPQTNFYIHCHLKILGLTKTTILIVKLSAADTSLVIKVWSKVLRDRIHRLPNLTIWETPFLMFLPEVAYYATNNLNHVFFFFPKFS